MRASSSREPALSSFEDGKRLTALSPAGFVEVDGLDRRRDIADLTRQALARLDPNNRAAFVLIVAELPVGEAAAILEIPASLVRKRARRARLLVSGYIRDLTGDRPAVAIDCGQS
jgi:DNA-directed RNA polymerase specialized sigma24 family protein